ERSEFQKSMIVEFHRFGKALVIDGKIQSTVSDEFIYHETLVHPLLVSLERPPRKVLVLGAGEGATVREVLKHKSVQELVMVDIDKVVIEFAKKYLQEWHQGAFDDPRVKLVIDDAYNYVMNTKDKFDAIIMDLTDPIAGGPSQRLYTQEFFAAVKERLNDGGGFVTQSTSPSFSLETFAIIRNTLKKVFTHVSYGIVYVPAFDGLWGFNYASDSIDPSKLKAEEVDRLIKERITGELKFYDGESHESLFRVPKYLRKAIDSVKGISTLANPVSVPA
ncbi:MAG: polyamine aminopropyltransferase, partial [Thermoprotei archaeon]